jgi:uncharacterized membrane protein
MAPTQFAPVGRQSGRESLGRAEGAGPHQLRQHVNVGDGERLVSVAGGAALGLYGLSRGSLGGLALAALGGALAYRGLSGHCNLYHALGFSTAGRRGPATSVPAGHGFKVERAITINRPPEAIYRFWRDFANLGRFMRHLESVRTTGGNRSHWVARGPLGYRVEWDAEIHNERPNELIAWRSLEGSEVDTAGSVHFKPAPAGRGTDVLVSLKYDPPAGKAGARLAELFGEAPAQTIWEDLRQLKQFLETVEIATTRGQPQVSCR